MVKPKGLALEKKPRASLGAAQFRSNTRSSKQNLLLIQAPQDTRPDAVHPVGPISGLRSRQGALAAHAPPGKLGAFKRQLVDEEKEHDAEKENKRPRKQEPHWSRAQQLKDLQPPPPAPPAAPHPAKVPLPAQAYGDRRSVEARLSGVGASVGMGNWSPQAGTSATAACFQPWNRDHLALVHSALQGGSSVDSTRSSNSSNSTVSNSYRRSSCTRSGTLSRSSSNYLGSAKDEPREAETSSIRADTGIGCTDGAPLGREHHFKHLHDLLVQSCAEGLGRSVYISGLPGTGKSHTVRAVLDVLRQQQGGQQLCSVFLSCFSLGDPSDVYKALFAACKQSITGSTGMPLLPASASPQQAYQQLVALLQTSSTRAAGKAGAKRKAGSGSSMFVLVLDEVDRLLLKGTEDLYKLFMLPQTAGVRCSVVAMANSIDITERSLPALKCRGCTPEFLPFTAYSRPQVLSILSSKLAALPWPVFQQNALELAARKVSSTTGDLRKVFQACRFALTNLHDRVAAAAEQGDAAPNSNDSSSLNVQQPGLPGLEHAVEHRAASKLVGVSDMAAALSRLNYQAGSGVSSVNTIRGLPQQQQLHLLALATAVATAAVQAAAAAEADAAAQQHGLTTSAFRTKYYWGPAVLGPKQVKSSNPFALDVQRSITQQGSSTAPGAAAVCAGRQASVHSMLGQGVKEQLRKGPTREASGQGAACHATPSAQHGQCSSGSGSASLGGCAQQVMGAAAGAGNREGSAATIVGSGALCAGDAARMVPLARAYEQSRRLAVQMFQQPVSEQEFRSAMQLLSHTGLVGVDAAGAPQLIRAVGQGVAGSSAKAKEGGAALSLKVQMKDIQAALRDNVLFKKVLSGLPAA